MVSISSRTPEVWDLDDMSTPAVVTEERPRPGLAIGGPLAATVGLLAVGVALLPGVPVIARWCLAVLLGLAAVAIAVATLRRRQIVLTVLFAVAGLVAPVAATGVLLATPTAPAAVENQALPPAAFVGAATDVHVTPSLQAREQERGAVRTATQFMALHLRAMHGTYGPYPLQLGDDDGAVIEQEGTITGVRVGDLPAGAHLTYSVTPDLRFFKIRLTLDDDATAWASADSTLDLPVD